MPYSGWKNYNTWNVALWIGNDEGLYSFAKTLQAHNNPYQGFHVSLLVMNAHIGSIRIALKTPDDVDWSDPRLDTKALDEMIREL